MKPNLDLKKQLGLFCTLAFLCAFECALASPFFGQQPTPDSQISPTGQQARKAQKKKARGPGKEMGKGGEDIGKGVGKGAESLGKGTAGAAGDLVTLHPVDAAASLGKGTAGLGKDVGVGSVKGTAKIGKGAGGEFKKLGKKATGKHDKKTPEQ
jgi:hypothetical protein